MSKNAFGQSDSIILELTIPEVKTDKSTWFLTYKFSVKKRKRWFVHF